MFFDLAPRVTALHYLRVVYLVREDSSLVAFFVRKRKTAEMGDAKSSAPGVSLCSNYQSIPMYAQGDRFLLLGFKQNILAHSAKRYPSTLPGKLRWGNCCFHVVVMS